MSCSLLSPSTWFLSAPLLQNEHFVYYVHTINWIFFLLCILRFSFFIQFWVSFCLSGGVVCFRCVYLFNLFHFLWCSRKRNSLPFLHWHYHYERQQGQGLLTIHYCYFIVKSFASFVFLRLLPRWLLISMCAMCALGDMENMSKFDYIFASRLPSAYNLHMCISDENRSVSATPAIFSPVSTFFPQHEQALRRLACDIRIDDTTGD